MKRPDRRVVVAGLAIMGCALSLTCGGGGEAVEPVASVVVDPTTLTLTALGATQPLTATVYGKIGAFANPQVTWTSDAPSVVSVQGSGESAMATARGVGTARITATSGDKSGTTTVTVAAPDVTLAVQLGGAGTGTVSSVPSGISCTTTSGSLSGTCSAGFPTGQTVTLSAVPATNHSFGGWTGGGCTQTQTGPCAVSMSRAQAVTASFTAPVTITVTANPSAGGTVSGGGPAAVGSTATVVATPSAGWSFTSWTENGGVVSSTASYSFAATTNRTLVANFRQNPFTIAVTANPVAGGTVSGGGVYDPNTAVTVTATGASGYTFTNWTENGAIVSNSAKYEFTATTNRTLVANFTQNPFTITVSAIPPAGGVVTGGGVYAPNSAVTVLAAASTGFTFENWTEMGAVVSSTASYSFTVTGNRSLVASFTPGPCTITVIANPTIGGTVSGGGTRPCGSPVSVTATPATGYAFVNWTVNGTVLSTTPNYTGTPTTNQTWAANFAVLTGPPVIVVSPTTITFSMVQCDPNPNDQVLSVSNGGAGVLSGLSASWAGMPVFALFVRSISSTTAPSTIALGASIAFENPITYTQASVNVASPVAANSPVNVPVTVIISPPRTPKIGASPASLSFTASRGGANPSTQTVSITNPVSTFFPPGQNPNCEVKGLALGNVTYGPGASGWLTVGALGSTASPASFTVQAITGSLAAGTYTATIPISANPASNSPLNLLVTFTVQ